MFAIAAFVLATATTPAPHPPEFWQSIAKNGCAVPPGETAPVLARELSTFLGSPDPTLRDGTAYTILTEWIYEKRTLSDDDLRPIIAEWTANLRQGIGSTGDDSVLRRSFSALMLSVVVARDNDHHDLTPEEFRGLLDSAIAYERDERDLRGYDPQKGWIHSAAHTADLLKFLGRSRYVTAADQKAILDAIAGKLRRSTIVFDYGEDERMARAVLSIVRRDDFDANGFSAWLAALPPRRIDDEHPAPESLHVAQNTKNMLTKLYVIVSQQPAAPGIDSAKIGIVTALARAF